MMKTIGAVVIIVSTVTLSINAQTSGLVSPYFFDAEGFNMYVQSTNASDYVKVPELYYDLDSYFLDETLYWFSFLSRGIDRALPLGGYYQSVYLNFRGPTDDNEDDDYGRMDVNAYLNLKIRLGEYFILPFFMALVIKNIGGGKDSGSGDILNENEGGTTDQTFGAGLIFKNKFGMIGAFSGVKVEENYIVNWRGRTEKVYDTSHPIYIVPRFNTGESPVVGFFVEKIFGFVGVKTTGGISAYSAAIASHTVNFKNQDMRFEIYHNSKSYNYEAENRNYGVRINLPPYWSFDAGFRHYFNVEGDSYNYDNTGYGKIILQIPTSYVLCGFYVSADNNYFPWPQFGFELTYALGSVSFNFGATRNYYEFSLALRNYF